MTKTTKTTPAAKRGRPRKPNGTAGTRSVKITERSYRILERIARREQRTIVAVIDRATETYRAQTEGSSK